MLHYIRLHLSAVVREPSLQEWIHSWASSGDVSPTWLSPMDWCHFGHKASCGIWCPPPAAADAAFTELAKAIHKRPHLEQILVIPRLMTSRWHRLFGKLCDLQFTVPIGCSFWSFSQNEPLVVGLIFPFICHRPW